MMTTLLWIIAVLLILIGLVGVLLPVLPGVPLIFFGILMAAWIDDFQRISVLMMIMMAFLTVSAVLIDYIASAVSAQRAGASRQGVIGAFLGTVLGIIVGLWGLLFMPLIGAVIGEFMAHRDIFRAGKIGVATWVGLFIAAVTKLAIACTMIGIFIMALII